MADKSLIPSRYADRSSQEREMIYSILDKNFIAHVGFVLEGNPMVLPTLFARVEDEIFIHGSTGSHMLRSILKCPSISLSVASLNGWVLAKSLFNHSANYESVVVFAAPRKVQDTDEKCKLLIAVCEKLIPGRSEDCRLPNIEELNQTLMIGFSLEKASSKVRTGLPTSPNEEDALLPYWTGVVPFETKVMQLQPTVESEGREIPHYLFSAHPRKGL